MRHKAKLAATTCVPDTVVTQFAELGKVASSIDVDDLPNLSIFIREVVRSLRASHLVKLRAPAVYADFQKAASLLQLLPPHVQVSVQIDRRGP